MLYFIENACPNCQGIISDERLKKGLPCEKCLTEDFSESPRSLLEVCELLEKRDSLANLRIFGEVEKKVEVFKKIFTEIIEAPPSSLQINWAKRFFLGESFAIIAPTGTGKSTFGLISSLLTGRKALIVVPTKVLVNQVEEKLQNFISKISDPTIRQRKILPYTGEKKEKALLEQQKFDIFICTSAFMHRNFSVLKEIDFSLIFVDDVDSFLKNSKNVDHLFILLGFSEEDIKLALKRAKEEEDYFELNKIKVAQKKLQKQLLISSATLKPKTNRVLLFQNLLGFEITRFVSTLRKVIDTYILINPEEKNPSPSLILQLLLDKAEKLIKKLGKGGLIFVEESFGKEKIEFITEHLKERGIKAISYLEVREDELLEKLKTGKVDVAVGLCHLGNPLVRGIDLPEALRYALFLGVPKHTFPLSKDKEGFKIGISPQFLHNLLLSLMPLFEDEEKITAISYVNYLKKFLTIKETDIVRYEGLHKKILSVKEFLEEKLRSSDFVAKLMNSEEVFLEVDPEGGYRIVLGNASAYLQASGRVSRLTTKGLFPGLSVILVDNLKALNSLKKRLKFYLGEEVDLKPIDLKEAVEINKKIKQERQMLTQEKLDFKNYLLIVESPHKAKTIANFFGKPAIRRINSIWVYEIPMEEVLLSVCASLGHIYNLSRKKGVFGVIKTNGNFIPVFNTIKLDRKTGNQYVDEEEILNLKEQVEILDKREIVDTLRYLSFCADQVFIASDPDAEGEKIAYDLYVSLKPFQPNINRLEFHEVTVRAFKEALKSPQEINLPRVKAQLARRIADRWVGFSLSQELWKIFNKKYLSAGRVQTPVLGWIIKRAEEAKQYRYRVYFLVNGFTFFKDFEDKDLAEKFLSNFKDLKITVIEEREEELSPPPPYTTDTILEEAFTYFKFSSSYTMSLLQELFELGLITYHRTDSTRISEVGRYQVAKPYITQALGEEFFYPREWFSPGAHEGIRPTRPWDVNEIKLRVAHGLISFRKPSDSFKLYDIIFRRFMASQTRKTQVQKLRLKFELFSISWEEEVITKILQSGYEYFWTKPHLFPFKEPFEIDLHDRPFVKIPKAFLYNQGTLIQEMKKRGLGRPSTYAEIVSTLLARYYVYELKNGGLVPTNLGKKVFEYLKERFEKYVSEEFTRDLETFMDEVEEGKKEWTEICETLLPLLEELEIFKIPHTS